MITDTKPPLDEALLKHYGVKGMKWGVRRSDEQLERARKYRPTTKQKQVAIGTLIGIGVGAAAAIMISTGTVPLTFVSAPASAAATSAASTLGTAAAKKALGSKTVNDFFKDPSGSGHSVFNSSVGQLGSFDPDVSPQGTFNPNIAPKGKFNPNIAPQGKFNPDVKR